MSGSAVSKRSRLLLAKYRGERCAALEQVERILATYNYGETVSRENRNFSRWVKDGPSF